MKDALAVLLAVLPAFPFGAGFAAFLRWLSKQKRDALSRQGVANSWPVLGTFGVSFNLLFVATYAGQHNPNQVQNHLIQAAFFASAFLGAWAETRRFQRGR